MNSWKSTLLSAWAPPFSTFIIGTGSTVASAPPRKRYRGSPASAAAARATASETPRIALAPSRDLLGVPSRSISVRSMAPCSVARAPTSAPAMSWLTLDTALATPLPLQASPPSRSSVASNSPVEAPEGTAARPLAPESSVTSTSTVGFPRESRIWRAWIRSIVGMAAEVCQAGPTARADAGLPAPLAPTRAFQAPIGSPAAQGVVAKRRPRRHRAQEPVIEGSRK